MHHHLLVPSDGSEFFERAVEAILGAAAEYGCDAIVMAMHGRGVFGELLSGSHTKNLLARTRLPLLVLH